MKLTLIALLLSLGCGDNIIPEPDAGTPDARNYGYGFDNDVTIVYWTPDAGVPEPDAGVPVCVDKHMPKHPHKCRHLIRGH